MDAGNGEVSRQAAAVDKLELEKAFTRLGQLLRERRVAGPEKVAEIRSIARQINAPDKP